jgi:molecular chaperone DnaK
MTIIGIDLGTSNSAAAVLRDGRPVIFPSAEGLSVAACDTASDTSKSINITSSTRLSACEMVDAEYREKK